MRNGSRPPGAGRRVARSRGATSGIVLIVLGAWGALIPFIGPYFNFSYTPDKAWTWSAARGWLEVFPGAVVFVGGVLLLLSSSRMMTLLGAWLAMIGGAWFVVGPQLNVPLHLGSPGVPAGSETGLRALESIAMFYGLGAVIIFFGAVAFGRLSVVSLRDVHAAERRQEAAAESAAVEREPEREPVREPVARPSEYQGDATRPTAESAGPEYEPGAPRSAGYGTPTSHEANGR
jgi:hypothetical protein